MQPSDSQIAALGSAGLTGIFAGLALSGAGGSTAQIVSASLAGVFGLVAIGLGIRETIMNRRTQREFLDYQHGLRAGEEPEAPDSP